MSDFLDVIYDSVSQTTITTQKQVKTHLLNTET